MGLVGPLAFVLLAFSTFGGFVGWHRERRLKQSAEHAVSEADERSASSIRLLRLAAGELRGVALSLVGHSQTGAGSNRGTIRIVDQLFGISETLLAQSEAPGAIRRLDEEMVPLQPVLEFAIAQVAAGLEPSRRAWRIGGLPAGIGLLADKRALNHILINVLSGAAASTCDGDGIDVSLCHSEDSLLLQIEDEGAGLPLAEAGRHESRGIGYGLILARSLMEAHGGRLDVESLARVGTRVRLMFPAERARQPACRSP